MKNLFYILTTLAAFLVIILLYNSVKKLQRYVNQQTENMAYSEKVFISHISNSVVINNHLIKQHYNLYIEQENQLIPFTEFLSTHQNCAILWVNETSCNSCIDKIYEQVQKTSFYKRKLFLLYNTNNVRSHQIIKNKYPEILCLRCEPLLPEIFDFSSNKPILTFYSETHILQSFAMHDILLESVFSILENNMIN